MGRTLNFLFRWSVRVKSLNQNKNKMILLSLLLLAAVNACNTPECYTQENWCRVRFYTCLSAASRDNLCSSMQKVCENEDDDCNSRIMDCFSKDDNKRDDICEWEYISCIYNVLGWCENVILDKNRLLTVINERIYDCRCQCTTSDDKGLVIRRDIRSRQDYWIHLQHQYYWEE